MAGRELTGSVKYFAAQLGLHCIKDWDCRKASPRIGHGNRLLSFRGISPITSHSVLPTTAP